MGLFGQIFSWWDGASLGTNVFTLLRGKLVGRDEFGNRYYEDKKAMVLHGRESRRWVVYRGLAEASKVPPEWHGWLHHTFEAPPTAAPFKTKSWEKQHIPNLSGTPFARRPSGSLWRGGERPHATGDYEPWKPEGA